MPYSADENREWITSYINTDDVILDVGAGAGIWADLLKDTAKQIDAVEIFEPYIDRFNLKNKYSHIYLGDFRTLDIPFGKYSIIILGDVLEHFEYEDALKVWHKARLLVGASGFVLMSTPIIEWPQGEVDGNIHETHLTFFKMNDLKKLPGVIKYQEGLQIGSVLALGTAPPITVLIPSIATRTNFLRVAINSVQKQTLRPAAIIVQMDEFKMGAASNRDSGLQQVETEWVALLDDDDYFYQNHLEVLYKTALETDADIVYSWFDVINGTDPFPENFGQEWDPENPIQTTITILAKTEVLKKAGGYTNSWASDLTKFAQGNTVGEDFRIIYSANKNGAKIVHAPYRTWAYRHHAHNTSGLPERW